MKPTADKPHTRMRLQRFLAQAGLASRREAERLIEEGHVEVGGKTAVLGTAVDPAVDRVTVDGRPVRQATQKVYLALNKPRQVLCTRSDPAGRPTVMDYVPARSGLVMPAGRLDYYTSGLLLMTNDGDLIQRLLRPDSNVEKVYRVKSARPLESDELERFRTGIPLDGRRTRPARIRSVPERAGVWYEVVLTEGRNRQVRRMFQALGHRVQKLTRIAVGPLVLGNLEPGQVRALTDREVEALKRAVGLAPPAVRPTRKPGWAAPRKRPVRPGPNRPVRGSQGGKQTKSGASGPRRKAR